MTTAQTPASAGAPTSREGQGLEDVIAGPSAICEVNGEKGQLIYRGYDIHDLARYSTFEETTYLLWHGKLPTRAQLTSLEQELQANRALPPEALIGSRLLAGSTSGLAERGKRPSGSLAIVCAIEHARVDMLTFCYGTFLKGSSPPMDLPQRL